MENSEKKANTNKYSREIVMPKLVADKYILYCQLTKMKLSEPLRVMVMESISQLHNAKNLDQIIQLTKNWKSHGEEFEKFHVRLPDTVIREIHTYLSFFKLNIKILPPIGGSAIYYTIIS